MSNQIAGRYDGVTVSGVTTAQLQDPLGNVYLSVKNKPAASRLAKMIGLKILQSTYQGLPLPGKGAITSSASFPVTVQPSAGSIYQVEGISIVDGGAGGTYSVLLTDGADGVTIASGSVSGGATSTIGLDTPLYLTKSLYLQVTYSAGAVAAIAYQQPAM